MGEWIRKDFLKPEVGPGVRLEKTAGGSIGAKRLVKLSGSNVVVASTDEASVYGVSVETAAVISGATVDVARGGLVEGVADVAITKGDSLKAGYLGKLVPLLTASKAAGTIKASTGGNFGNQPANDGVEVISDSVSDVQVMRIYGTTNGGNTVVVEDLTLTGTSAASTVKTDWGVILGCELISGGRAVGTITVREASGNATITTFSAGDTRKGVVVVSGSAQRAFNRIPMIHAGGASTKVVGVVGTTPAGVAINQAASLSGTTKVAMTSAMQSVTKILVGDVASASTATVITNEIPDSNNLQVGVAQEAAAAGDEFEFEFLPLQRIEAAQLPLVGRQIKKFTYSFATHGGAVGAITLTDESGNRAQIPADANILGAYYEVETAFTSGGAATVALGYTGAATAFKAATAFDDATYAIDTFAAGSASVAKVTAAKDVLLTVVAAALTAGKVHVFVEYMVGA